MLLNSLAVAAGGALGSLARFWLAELLATLGVAGFPWATLLANVSGSLLIGVLAALMAGEGRFPDSPAWRLFWVVGICGGYTTFSSFSLQTLELAQGHAWIRAALNVLLSVALCLGAVWLGYHAAAAGRGWRP
jgi:fluoride exporter